MKHSFGVAAAMIRGDDQKAMTKEASDKTTDNARKTRLAEELRANLQKRKAQLRSRRTGAADSRPEGIAASTKNSNE